MKLIYPKKKTVEQKPGILWGITLAFVLLLGSFLSGMFFYRGGYASNFLANIRNGAENQFVNDVVNELETEARLYQVNGLATVFLDIPFDAMTQVEEKRQEALSVGILLSTDDDYVSASIRYNDEESLDMKIRLKGDWVDHLKTDKWSFRVHITENDGAILGMKRFSLQAPETRNYTSEWGYHQNLMLEGILTPRYHFVNLVINGEHKGIFALEESFAEDLLESQERREGIILKMDEDLLWNNWARFINGGQIWYVAREEGFFWLTDGAINNEIAPFRGSHIASSEVLSAELIAATELLYSYNQGMLAADQILDEELWGRYYAITDLWAAGHAAIWHNQRFYYNPVTGLLEPLAFDGLALPLKYQSEGIAHLFDHEALFDTPEVQKAYIETLERITTPEYIAMLNTKFGNELGEYYTLLVNEYKNTEVQGDSLLQLPWDTLDLRSDMLSRNLDPKQPIRGNYHIVEENGETFLQLDLVNLMVVPVQINEIVLAKKSENATSEWCRDESCASQIVGEKNELVMLSGEKSDFVPVSFWVPIKELESSDPNNLPLTLSVNLYGGTKSFDIPIYANYVPQGVEAGVKPSATLEEALATHPFLIELGSNELAIARGDWDVTGDLVIPEDYKLIILAGTTLRFEEESVFLVHGAVEIKGGEDAPVLLTAQAESWGGMVILDATEKSIWQYLVAEKMAGISRSGWELTGGITFYESAVDIAFSQIGNNTTEDALNIIRAPFSFYQVEFLNTTSDAFDGDFTTGTVTQCSFHDIAGDAFDVSGTEATIIDSYFVDIGDKAISAGEASHLTVNNLTIRNVAIGIASKDLSSVLADNLEIDTARVTGLAAYIKKPQYGAASITATNVNIINTEKSVICQTGSSLQLNAQEVQPEEINVDALYDAGILGN